MIHQQLALPDRESKPRRRGLTIMIDNGMATGLFEDVVDSTGHYVDIVKFGWGTALVTPDLRKKIDALRRHDIGYTFGGTLFERYVMEGKFAAYRALCRQHGCQWVEVSNGTIELDDLSKAGFIRELVPEFNVLSEVGYKDPKRSELLSPSQWIRSIRSDLDAGARLIVLEARENGSGGICRPDGELRYGLIEDILRAGLSTERLVFEAPTKTLQVYFVTRVGAAVNLGNVAPFDLIALETLRLGLRADTLPGAARLKSMPADVL